MFFILCQMHRFVNINKDIFKYLTFSTKLHCPFWKNYTKKRDFISEISKHSTVGAFSYLFDKCLNHLQGSAQCRCLCPVPAGFYK